MPFTANEFLYVFAAYNRTLWPFAAALWLLTAFVCAAVIARTSIWPRLPTFLLAGHWLWAGVVYHAVFFTAINPAAWLFAAVFVAQGLLFAFAPPFSPGRGAARRVVSSALMAYSLVYPLVVVADGFAYPRMPTFGVPCPTVMLTIGLLVAASTPSILLSMMPVAWSLLGASAVQLFGVHADLALPASGVVLVADLVLRRSHVMRKLSFASVVVALIALVIFVPAPAAFAQAAEHDHAQQAQQGGKKMGEMKMDPKMMEDMAAKKKANTARINALMATVKSSSGDAKVAAMADLIGIMLDERAAMQEHCASMMQMMHMMHK